ncbi:MAG: FAD-dependent oxidoreductase [Bdellovibrionales bacterium]|nr:FAD-dependent oxidoreductase [Bdellovibrionales bacterium]
MFARRFKCEVLENRKLTPTVFALRFKTRKKIRFRAGQFISVFVPQEGKRKPARRCYSFASGPEEKDYLLCVKYVPGGKGSEYLGSLKPGDTFEATAPYGHFELRDPVPGKGLLFIATGTGIAPILSMIKSIKAKGAFRGPCVVIFGAKNEQEILFERELRALGVQSLFALSSASASWKGFHGRVTTLLRSLPPNFDWQQWDYYVCGSGEMISEVGAMLQSLCPKTTIHSEAFSSATKRGPEAPATTTSPLLRQSDGCA